MRNRFFYLFLLLGISLVPSSLMAQRYFNSPFSRFNLGTYETTGSFRSLAMGGTGIGMRTNDNIYDINPASYSSLDTNSFVFDFGLDYGILTVSDGASSHQSDDMGFHHLTLGFPIMKGWGASLGITPLTNSYYSLSTKDEIGSTISHTGEGGLTKVFLGTGARVFEGLSIGANMNIIYGEIKRSNYYTFNDSYVNNVLNYEYLYLRGIYFDLGAQYALTFKEKYFLNVGISTNVGNSLKSTGNTYTDTFNDYTSTTIYNIYDDSTKAVLPTGLKAGVSFGIKDKLTIGIDYTNSLWSEARIYNSGNYLANSNSFNIGAEYIPDRQAYYNFLQRVEYRIGAHFGTDYLTINNEQIKEWGVSAGLGIPMRRTTSKVNLFVDYSKKALPSSSAANLKENYLSFGISLNIFEIWFMQQQYE